MNPPIPSVTTSNAAGKPRVALALATALGLGYAPVAPGTFGSLAGIFVYALVGYLFPFGAGRGAAFSTASGFWLELAVTAVIAVAGVWAAARSERFSARKDPQFVVIDEVSGQQFTYLLSMAPLNWKYLLLGFILFRVFDIWKPFPARQAESVPGGLGIMADDWIAGIYAALGLWLARGLGL
jgi:phosphatidylglycerophosphatase A